MATGSPLPLDGGGLGRGWVSQRALPVRALLPVFSPFIRYFDEVARQGSIRRAADRLNVAPSAVNRQILKLEDELGAPLFERLPRAAPHRGRRDPRRERAPLAAGLRPRPR